MGNQTDRLFHRFVAKSQMVTEAQLAECQTALEELNVDEAQVTLKELLLQRGYLSPEDAVRAEKVVKLEDSLLDLPEERQLGGYTVLTPLGRGGMASVYLARAEGRDSYVALKVLHKEVCERADIVERMIRETRALFQLEHPNIVRGHEFGNIDGRFYLAMEFVEGETLKSFVKKKGSLTESEALDFVEQIAEALAYAHESGFIHRDIKPRNLIVGPDGRIKILDFGLSKSLRNEEQELTQDGHLLGTVLYASPEQLRGARDVDSRADIYSLGITLFFMLTGKVPFRGATSTATAALHLECPLPDIQQERADLSDGLEVLLCRMTAKAPEDRYQSPGELLEDIQRLRTGGTVADFRPVSVSTGVVSARKLARLTRFAPVAAVLLLAAVFFWYSRIPPSVVLPGGPVGDSFSPGSSRSVSAMAVPSSPATDETARPVFSRLEAHVSELVKKGQFAEAYQIFDDLPAILFMPPWSKQVSTLKENVLGQAREELIRRKLNWLLLSRRQKLRAIENFATRVPAPLKKELTALRKQIEEASRVAKLPAPAVTPEQALGRTGKTPDEEPKPGTQKAPSQQGEVAVIVATESAEDDKGTTAQDKDAQSPGQLGTPQGTRVSVTGSPAKALILLAQSAFKEKKWQRALELIHLVLGKYEEDKPVLGERPELLRMKFRCEAELAPLTSLFAGQILRFEDRHLEIEYDFSTQQELEDWLPSRGSWVIDSGRLGRSRAGRRDLIWWRHPHSADFRLSYQARGLSHLSAVVAGNGLSADDGTGYVCGLGHYGGSQAIIRSRPQSPLARKDLLVNPLHLYEVTIYRNRKLLYMKSGQKINLRARLRDKWQTPVAGNGLRLGLFGWDDNQTRYEKVHIETELADEWLKAERARIYMKKMVKADLLKKEHFISFGQKNGYAFIPARGAPLLGEAWTIEFWFRVDKLRRKQKATLFSLGIDESPVLIMVKNSGREFQLGFRLGSISEVIKLENLNGWQHLALGTDGHRGNLFLNGNRLRRSFLVKEPPTGVLPIILGYGQGAGLNGGVDDLRISRGAIYSSLFAPQRPLSATDTTALLYSFNETSGNVAHDSVAGTTSCYLFGARFMALESPANTTP